MRVLAISDAVEPLLYGEQLDRYASGVDAVVSCGDLPFEYLEYIVTFSGAPLYYVRGNHDPDEGKKTPGGCVPLDGRVVDAGGGLVLAGLSGSRLYSGGANQYGERAMRRRARALSARVSLRKLLGKAKPNAFVSHAPPFGLGDSDDLAHVGFESFLPLIDRHNPELWLHGHVHLYGPNESRETRRGVTRVVNAHGHHILEVAGEESGM